MVFFFKQKTAYELRISDWSSDVCSSDLANPVFSIPFANLRTVARLFPRYAGDPCVGATNSATITQCTAKGYRGAYDSNNPANLQGGYFFGGNANIAAERGKTRSEEHTSELQSLMRISYAVFCLKKK